MDEFKRHKVQLYKFFDDITGKIATDHKFWRLICRVKYNFEEDPAEVKELKLKEIRAIMKINWHVDISTCELVEKTLAELVGEYSEKSPLTTEEK